MEQVMNMGLFFVLSILKNGTGIEQRKKTVEFYSVQFLSTKNARVAHCGNYVKGGKKDTNLRTLRDLSNNNSSRNYFGRYTGVRYAM